MTDEQREVSASTGTANTEIPSQNTILLEANATHVNINRHSTAAPEKAPAEIDKSQVLPPPIPLLPQPPSERAESSPAEKMILTLHGLPTYSASRSKVLLVEDNFINMKVTLIPQPVSISF
jgi:hypothetical protein